jgi:hypothetical protein
MAAAADAERKRLEDEAKEQATEGDLKDPFAGPALPGGIQAPATGGADDGWPGGDA